MVEKAVLSELHSRGIHTGANGTVLVTLEVTRFWNDFKTGFFSGDAIAELQIAVQVKNAAGTIVYAHNVAVSGAESHIQIAGGDNAERALNAALAAGVQARANSSSPRKRGRSWRRGSSRCARPCGRASRASGPASRSGAAY